MKEENLNSLAIAVFLCANPLAWLFAFVPKVIVFIILFSWLIVIYNRQLSRIAKLPSYLLLFSLLTTSIFLISLLRNSTESLVEYFIFFIVCGITGVYFSHLKFSISKLFYYIGLISLVLIPVVLTMDFGDANFESVDYGMWMGVSYGVLRFILALLAILLLYKNQYSFFKKLLFCISLLVFLFIYMNYASRGAMLGIVVFLVIFYFIKDRMTIKKKNIMFILSFLTIIIAFNFEYFIESVNDFLLSRGIYVKAIDKVIVLLRSGNLDNGRGSLIEKGLEGFYNSPFIGNGFGGFEQEYGVGYYVHNFLIQILYEGGVILFIPILLIMILSFVFIFSSKNRYQERVLLLFLFCSGIIELLFSSVYWKSVFFWFYIFYIIKLLVKKKERIIYE